MYWAKIFENYRYWSSVPYCEISDKDKIKYRLAKGDIVIARTGASTGSVAIMNEDIDAVFASYLIRFRINPKKANSEFVYYVLKSELWNSFLGSVISGSAQPGANAKLLGRFEFSLPSLKEQIVITKILSDIDSKIELNHSMNVTLEAIGRDLFNRWFVDYEFPDEKGRPYKSSGGEMVYCKELGEEIPKGWSVKSLNEVAEFTRGFSYKGSEKNAINAENIFITLNSVKEGGGFKREFCYIASDRVKERHFVEEGGIVITNTEQTKTGTLLGYPALVEFPREYKKNNSVFSHHITKVSPSLKDLKYYLYFYLYFNQQNAVKYHTGSVIWALDVGGWSTNEKILVPETKLLGRFEEMIKAVFRTKVENNHQSETLVSIRDSLLPKLMSGEIRVPT